MAKFMLDGQEYCGGGSQIVELTQAQYDALPDTKNTDNILYAITDCDELSAENMAFDDTETQLGVNNVQDAIVEMNKKNAGELLWTNPDITSEFASQTITFDFEDYEFLEIYYVFHRTTSVFLSQKCLANHSTVICMNDVNSIYRRNITVSNGGLLISTCDGYTIKTNTGFSNNEYIIPYKIYGLK